MTAIFSLFIQPAEASVSCTPNKQSRRCHRLVGLVNLHKQSYPAEIDVNCNYGNGRRSTTGKQQSIISTVRRHLRHGRTVPKGHRLVLGVVNVQTEDHVLPL